MCWAYCMFLDKHQPDRVEKNQETSLVPVTPPHPAQWLSGLHGVRLEELGEV